jgi:hypothetical protein
MLKGKNETKLSYSLCSSIDNLSAKPRVITSEIEDDMSKIHIHLTEIHQLCCCLDESLFVNIVIVFSLL